MAELKLAQAAEESKKQRDLQEREDDSETEAETVIDTGDAGSGVGGSKEVEVLERRGDLKDRGGSKSEISTEDEWERVSENEKDK